jgi:hypothetical protein
LRVLGVSVTVVSRIAAEGSPQRPVTIRALRGLPVTGIHEYDGFYAYCDDMPGGSNKDLRVGGTVVFQTRGWSVRLERRKGNTGINPLLLHLNLVFEAPADNVAQAITPVELEEWRIEDPQLEYEQVEFHMVGCDDDPPPVLRVTHLQ